MKSTSDTKGVVAAAHPRAAEEGALVLEAGGNAFDAALATAFVQMVVSPFSCGVGGMVSAHVWKAETGEHQVIDGCLRAGSLVTEDMWTEDLRGFAKFIDGSLFEDFRSDIGYTSVCTPGAVAALDQVHRRYCSMSWEELIRPAIDTARRGFIFSPITPSNLMPEPEPYSPDPVTRIHVSPDAARLYFRPLGEAPVGGVLVKNPDHAGTLERLARYGADDFYRGELAHDIVEDLSKNGSFVTQEDFRSYRTTTYAPRHVTYSGHDVYTNGSPGGGPLLAEVINVLEGLDLASLEHGGMQHLSYLASTLQLVNQDRRDYLGDSDVIGTGPEDTLWSLERAAELRKGVLDGAVGEWEPAPEGPDTTHLTAVDANGNIACVTHSLGSSSNVITPGLGFIYNDGMNRFDPRPGRASSLAPGKARVHLMMPTIVLRGGVPVMAVGAPGGNMILSALAQVISNVVDFGMSPVEALSATRIHAEGPTVWCEARTRTDTCNTLRERGFDVVHEPQSYASRALPQLVVIGADGQLEGASDPRGNGGVMYARA